MGQMSHGNHSVYFQSCHLEWPSEEPHTGCLWPRETIPGHPVCPMPLNAPCFPPLLTLWSFLNCLFWLHLKACGILVPQLGIKPTPPAVEAQILNYWTTREVPQSVFLSSVHIVKSYLVHKAPSSPSPLPRLIWLMCPTGTHLPGVCPPGALNSQKFTWHLKISMGSCDEKMNTQVY